MSLRVGQKNQPRGSRFPSDDKRGSRRTIFMLSHPHRNQRFYNLLAIEFFFKNKLPEVPEFAKYNII